MFYEIGYLFILIYKKKGLNKISLSLFDNKCIFMWMIFILWCILMMFVILVLYMYI